jgi:Uma2 family endonuclease
LLFGERRGGRFRVFRFHAALAAFIRPRRLGRVFGAPLDVHLPSGDILRPDVLYIGAARAATVQDWIRGAPDLVVEVLSPESRRRDLLVKPEIYLRNGVSEIWLADPDASTVEVRTSSGATRFAGSEVLVSPLLPGFALNLDDAFAP